MKQHDDFIFDALPQSAYFDGVLPAAIAEAAPEPQQEPPEQTTQDNNSDASTDEVGANETDTEASAGGAETSETQTSSSDSDSGENDNSNSDDSTSESTDQTTNDGESSTEVSEASDVESEEGVSSSDNETATEVVVIDESVPDHEELAADAQANGHDVIVVSSNDEKSGLEQVNEKLAEADKKYTAIHIVTHADNNDIVLGGDKINSNNIDDSADELAELGSYITEDGDILLYGCEIGQDEEFVNKLSEATGADIAASDDITGKDGDWLLEVNKGDIEARVAFSSEMKAAYAHNLEDVTGAAVNDSYTVGGADVLTGNVISNDTANEGKTLTIANYTQPNGGTVTIDKNGNFVFTPKAGFSGTTSFSYTVTEFDKDQHFREWKEIHVVEEIGTFSDVRDTTHSSDDGSLTATVSFDKVKIYETVLKTDGTGYETKPVLTITPDEGEFFGGSGGDVDFGIDGNKITVVVGGGQRTQEATIYTFDKSNPEATLNKQQEIPLPSGYSGDGLYISNDGNILVAGTPFAGKAGGTDPGTPGPSDTAGQAQVFIYNTTSDQYEHVKFLGNPLNEQSDDDGAGDHLGRAVKAAIREDGGYNLIVTAYNDSDDIPGGEVLVYQSTADDPANFKLILADRQGGGNGSTDDEYGITAAIDEKNPNYFAVNSYSQGTSIYKINEDGTAQEIISYITSPTGHAGNGIDFYDGILVGADRGGKTHVFSFDAETESVKHEHTYDVGGADVSYDGKAIYVGQGDKTVVIAPAGESYTARVDIFVVEVPEIEQPRAKAQIIEPEAEVVIDHLRHIHDRDDNNGDVYYDLNDKEYSGILPGVNQGADIAPTNVHIHLLVNNMDEMLNSQTFDLSNSVVTNDIDIQGLAQQLNNIDNSLTDLVSTHDELNQANSIQTAIDQVSVGTGQSF